MSKVEILGRIRAVGIIPVVRAASAEAALRAVDALRAAGLPIFEITLTVPGAVSLIEHLATTCGDDAVIGAGTVPDAAAARACIAAGARFIVSPSLHLETVAHCRSAGIAVLPGALTPTEIARAWEAGADWVKVFPAEAVGGARYIASIKAAMPDVELVPTGGVTLATAGGFIAAGAAAIGVGSDLISGRATQVGRAARAYLEAVRTARV